MTPQEQQLLQDLCARLTLTQGQPKDAQADAELRRGLSNAPDAVYWLAQRTLMLEQAIEQAQQQIGELQQQVKQAQQSQSQGAGSFLSGGLGTHFGRAPERYAEDGGYAASAQPPYQPQNQPSISLSTSRKQRLSPPAGATVSLAAARHRVLQRRRPTASQRPRLAAASWAMPQRPRPAWRAACFCSTGWRI